MFVRMAQLRRRAPLPNAEQGASSTVRRPPPRPSLWNPGRSGPETCNVIDFTPPRRDAARRRRNRPLADPGRNIEKTYAACRPSHRTPSERPRVTRLAGRPGRAADCWYCCSRSACGGAAGAAALWPMPVATPGRVGASAFCLATPDRIPPWPGWSRGAVGRVASWSRCAVRETAGPVRPRPPGSPVRIHGRQFLVIALEDIERIATRACRPGALRGTQLVSARSSAPRLRRPAVRVLARRGGLWRRPAAIGRFF